MDSVNNCCPLWWQSAIRINPLIFAVFRIFFGLTNKPPLTTLSFCIPRKERGISIQKDLDFLTKPVWLLRPCWLAAAAVGKMPSALHAKEEYDCLILGVYIVVWVCILECHKSGMYTSIPTLFHLQVHFHCQALIHCDFQPLCPCTCFHRESLKLECQGASVEDWPCCFSGCVYWAVNPQILSCLWITHRELKELPWM